MYTVTLVEFGTWKKRMTLTPVSGSYGRCRNAGRSGQMVLQAGDPNDAGLIIPDTTWPALNWVVVEWDGVPIYAAQITEAKYNWATKQVSLAHTDVWWFWGKRKVLNDRTRTFPESAINWTNLTPLTLAKRTIQVGIGGGSAPDYYLPIVFPADGPAGTVTRTVYGYSLETVQDILDEAMNGEAGIDIDFRPRWSAAGTLELVMEVNAYSTTQLEWDLDAEDQSVTDMNYRVNTDALATGVFGVGEGSEIRMLAATALATDVTYPAVEMSLPLKDYTTYPRLLGRTRSEMFALSGAVRQIDMTVMAGGEPSLDEFRLGSKLKWSADDDPWLLDGGSGDWELIEYSGNLSSEEVTMDFRPRVGN